MFCLMLQSRRRSVRRTGQRKEDGYLGAPNAKILKRKACIGLGGIRRSFSSNFDYKCSAPISKEIILDQGADFVLIHVV